MIVLRSVHEAGSVLCKMALYRFFYWLLQSRRLYKNSLPKQSQFPLKNSLILKPRNHQYATEQATNIPHGTDRQPTILPLDIFNIYSLDFYQAFNYEVQSKLAVALQDTCKSLSQTVIYKRCRVLNKKCACRDTKTFTFCTV